MIPSAIDSPETPQGPPATPHPKPRSPAQVAASRRNGARSKGPVSAAGKARSSRNVVRHGLLAAVDIAMPNEDPDGFRRLRDGLLADLGAADALTLLLVERLAGAFWRLARADRLEGEILAVAAGYEPRRDSPLDWGRIDLDRYTRLRARTETGFFRLVQLLLRARPTAQAVATASPTAQAVATGSPAAASGEPCGLADPPPCRDPHRPGALAELLGLDALVRKRRRQLGLPETAPPPRATGRDARPAEATSSSDPLGPGFVDPAAHAEPDRPETAEPAPEAASASMTDRLGEIAIRRNEPEPASTAPTRSDPPRPGFVDPATGLEPDRPRPTEPAPEAGPTHVTERRGEIPDRPNEAEPAAKASRPPLLTRPTPPPFDPRIPPESRPRRRPPGLPADLTGAIRLPERHPLPPEPPARPPAASPASRTAAAVPPEPGPLGPPPAALLATSRARWANAGGPLAAPPAQARSEGPSQEPSGHRSDVIVTRARHPIAAAMLALPLAACSVFGIRSGTEEPRHETLATLGDAVEIRRYGPRLAAETTVTAADSDAARNAAFRRLARYIFGGNQGERSIAMTAPVETAGVTIAMTVPVETAPAGAAGPGGFPGRGEPVRMRFFLPAELTLATAPLPEDPEVRLVELPAETLAVRRFTGFWDDARLESELAALLDALAGSAWTPDGPPRAMFYDPPWTIPWLRRNEVALPVVAADEP